MLRFDIYRAPSLAYNQPLGDRLSVA